MLGKRGSNGGDEVETADWLMAKDGVRLEIRIGGGPDGGDATLGVAVVCHPHPLYGGDMHNSVVRAMARAARDEGYIPLLFNFRGTGRSEGAHTGGLREVDDIDAVMERGRKLSGRGPVILMGYSFGAMVATKWLNGGGVADAFVGVAVPANSEPPEYAGLPSLFISGELDEVAPVDDGLYRAHQVDGLHVIVEECDHFFGEGLKEIEEAIKGFIDITLVQGEEVD
jgi:alpha/beta superfamily hydrolase